MKQLVAYKITPYLKQTKLALLNLGLETVLIKIMTKINGQIKSPTEKW